MGKEVTFKNHKLTILKNFTAFIIFVFTLYTQNNVFGTHTALISAAENNTKHGRKNLKTNLSEIELFTFYRYRDIAIQNSNFHSLLLSLLQTKFFLKLAEKFYHNSKLELTTNE